MAVGISAPSVFWHMRRLIADGIIEPHREGKMMRYCLTPEALGLLREETGHDGADDRTPRDGEEGVAV
ncbi:MAG: helix-turn-helix domain-containing protein [Methanoculleus bourgensis]|nr:helix-turn-helix domain-containing protein [Methanoculleus bourgensis]